VWIIYCTGDSAIEELRRRIGNMIFRTSELENEGNDLDFTDLAM